MKKSKFIEYQNDFAFLIDYARIYFKMGKRPYNTTEFVEILKDMKDMDILEGN